MPEERQYRGGWAGRSSSAASGGGWRARGCALLLAGLALLLGGCETLSYYRGAVTGHLDLLQRRQPMEVAIASAPDRETQGLLLTAARAREFASTRLGLPRNRSYATYAALGRPFVAWNVVAAPALSLEPLASCFPLVGCLPYRGFFQESAARSHAGALAARGMDVYVGGVAAYSTLGWFDDPVLDTMLRQGEARLVQVLFHEMAHQRLFLPSDAEFSEGYAEFVGRRGWVEWLRAEGGEAAGPQAVEAERRERDLLELMLATRQALAALYASSLAEEQKRRTKAAVLRAADLRYQALKACWGGHIGFDAWMAGGLDNAKLATVSTYFTLLDAFERLFVEVSGDWQEFHRQADQLAAQAAGERRRSLAQLAVRGRSSGRPAPDCAEHRIAGQ